MADLDEALYTYLIAQPDIATLIGLRLYPDFFPQDSLLPAVAYSLEDDESQATMQGPSLLRHAIYRFDAWAETRSAVMNVAREFRLALDGYKGTLSGVVIQACQLSGLGRTRDPETEAYNVSLRYDIWYVDAAVASASASASVSASASAS